MSAEIPARDVAKGLDDTRLLGFGHAREKRQGNGAGEMLFGHGEHALTVAESFLVEGVQVKRYEVNGGANSLALEFFDDQVAADGQHVAVDLNDVDMPGVLDMKWNFRRGEAFEGIQFARIAIGKGGAELAHALAFFELYEANRGLKIREIVFVADLLNVVAPGAFGGVALPRVAADAVQGEDAHAIGESAVLRSDHAAFAGGDGLGGVKRKTSDIANCANGSAFVCGRKGMSCVFDDFQIVTARDAQDRVHMVGIAGIMDGKNGACFGSDIALDKVGIHVKGARSTINEDRLGAEIKNDFAACGKGHGGKNYFVTRLEIDRGKRKVKRGCAGANGDGILCADARGKCRFELLDAGAGREPAAFEHFRNGADFFLADHGSMKRNERDGGCCGAHASDAPG